MIFCVIYLSSIFFSAISFLLMSHLEIDFWVEGEGEGEGIDRAVISFFPGVNTIFSLVIIFLALIIFVEYVCENKIKDPMKDRKRQKKEKKEEEEQKAIYYAKKIIDLQKSMEMELEMYIAMNPNFHKREGKTITRMLEETIEIIKKNEEEPSIIQLQNKYGDTLQNIYEALEKTTKIKGTITKEIGVSTFELVELILKKAKEAEKEMLDGVARNLEIERELLER